MGSCHQGSQGGGTGPLGEKEGTLQGAGSAPKKSAPSCPRVLGRGRKHSPLAPSLHSPSPSQLVWVPRVGLSGPNGF